MTDSYIILLQLMNYLLIVGQFVLVPFVHFSAKKLTIWSQFTNDLLISLSCYAKKVR